MRPMCDALRDCGLRSHAAWSRMRRIPTAPSSRIRRDRERGAAPFSRARARRACAGRSATACRGECVRKFHAHVPRSSRRPARSTAEISAKRTGVLLIGVSARTNRQTEREPAGRTSAGRMGVHLQHRRYSFAQSGAALHLKSGIARYLGDGVWVADGAVRDRSALSRSARWTVPGHLILVPAVGGLPLPPIACV